MARVPASVTVYRSYKLTTIWVEVSNLHALITGINILTLGPESMIQWGYRSMYTVPCKNTVLGARNVCVPTCISINILLSVSDDLRWSHIMIILVPMPCNCTKTRKLPSSSQSRWLWWHVNIFQYWVQIISSYHTRYQDVHACQLIIRVRLYCTDSLHICNNLGHRTVCM